MADTRKKLYGQVVKLDKVLKAVPGFCKTVVVLVLGGLAGEEFCKGRELLAYCFLGLGIFISLSGLCKRKNGVAKP